MRNIQRMNVFQQGLIWGVLLGILNLVVGSISTATHLVHLNQFFWVVDIVVYLFVGLAASQETSKTGTGALVGLFTGLVSAILSGVVGVINTIANVDALRQSAQSVANQHHLSIHYTNNMVILTALFGAIVALILGLVLGAIFGAIGGAIGKNQTRNTSVPEYTQYTHELIEK